MTNLPQVAFKKINETDYLYGSIRVTINTGNNNNLTGKFIIILKIFFSLLEKKWSKCHYFY